MADFDDFDSLKDNRFAHLLKPIRDLSENFSIDLAHELEEYLEQLEHAQFTFEGAKPGSGMVDFAEAALLIQGSTCVYSKKVEYLYNLVYQALEAVKGKKRQQQGLDGQQAEGDAGPAVAGGRAARGGAARGLDEDEDEGLERFWDIEQFLKETGDVDLGEGDSLLPAANTSMRQPAALLALEDHSQGAASGAAPGAKGDGDSGVYRLQQCYVHCSGALLLDARDGDFYDHLLRYVGPRSREDKSLEALIASQQLEQPTQLLPLPLTQLQPQLGPQAPGPGEQPHVQPDAMPEAGPLGAAEQQPMEADGAGPAGPMLSPHGDDDGFFDGGGGGPEDWPADAEPMREAAGATAAGVAEGEQQPGEAPQAEAGLERPRRAAAAAAAGGAVAVADAGAAGAGEEQEDEEEFDPYKPLDPASKGRMPDRPLVVRKPRRTRRPPSASLPARTHSAAASLRPRSLAAAMTGGGGLLLPEFAYCMPFLRPMGQGAENGLGSGMELDGRRGKNKKDLCKARQAGGVVAMAGGDAVRPVFDAQDAAAAVAADMAAAEEPLFGGAAAGAAAAAGAHGGDAWDDDGYFGDAGGGGGGASDIEDDEPPNDAVGGWEDGDGEEGHGGLMGRWSEGGVPPMALLGGGDEARADGDDGPSYEELCRAHMESMLRAAAAREVQSDLAKRVGNWRNRIDPVLKAEESRPAFDIQDYGERIIDRLSNLQVKDTSPGKEPAAAASKQQHKRVGFSAVAAQLQKYEISRLFSAMLQLINNRNVAIHKAEAAAAAVLEGEPFALELLSRDLYHKHMGDRLAADRIPQGRGEASGGAQDEGDGDEENYDGTQGGTQTQRQKGGARGKAAGAKRAKKAGAAPLAEANAMVD